jgi:hypothetical protein
VNAVNRVVVTGLGAITPLGHTVPVYWEKLKRGASGLGAITAQGWEELNQKIAGEVKDYDPLKYFEDRELSTLDRFSQFRSSPRAKRSPNPASSLTGRCRCAPRPLSGPGSAGRTRSTMLFAVSTWKRNSGCFRFQFRG